MPRHPRRRGARAVPAVRPLTPETLESLLEEVVAAEGHYGPEHRSHRWSASRVRGRRLGDAYEFNIKAYWSAPEWVDVYYGGEGATWSATSDDGADAIDWFTDGLMDKDSSIYLPWFEGHHGGAGRGGGYLLLEHGPWERTISDLLSEWDDHVEPTIRGPRMDPEFKKEVEETIQKIQEELDSLPELEKTIKEYVKDYENDRESDEYWQERLDLTNAQVRRLKSGKDLHTPDDFSPPRKTGRRGAEVKRRLPALRAKRKP